MAKVSMLIPDEALALIDSVANNRTSFMLEAAVKAARLERRRREDAEIACWCSERGESDAGLDDEFSFAVSDGLA